MFVLKSNYEALQRELSAVQTNLDYNTGIIKSKNAEIDELKAKIKSLYSEELEQCDFEIDFKAMNAFSIERITEKGKNRTVIGYLKNEDSSDVVIGEWYFDCSITQHQKLAEQFRKYLKK